MVGVVFKSALIFVCIKFSLYEYAIVDSLFLFIACIADVGINGILSGYPSLLFELYRIRFAECAGMDWAEEFSDFAP